MLPDIEAKSPRKKESTMNFFTKGKHEVEDLEYEADGKPMTPWAKIERDFQINLENAKKLAESKDQHSPFYWKLNELNDRIDQY